MSYPWFQQVPSNPYPASPYPIPHKVWILDCKNCHMFLTNRAMKAVLLLRPSVPLYSSDTLPVNCSPYNSDPDALWSPTARNSSITPRTCECLTQSLYCHGCGSAIGYMIIVPCSRCISSLSTTNRATNGHRFVFQSTKILETERHYIPNEMGIIPSGNNTVSSPQPPDSYGEASPIDSLSVPALEFTNILDYSGSWTHLDNHVYSSPLQYRVSHSPNPAQLYYHPSDYPTNSTDARSQPPASPNADSSTADRWKYACTTPPILKAGDVIFWHHLAKSGEILEIVDDERARRPARKSANGGIDFDR